MVSISPRWVSLKLCADADIGAPQNARANNAGMRRRNEGIGKSLCGEFPGNSAEGRLLKVSRFSGPITAEPGLFLVALLAGQRLGAHNVVSLDPSRRADREARFCARCEIARRL